MALNGRNADKMTIWNMDTSRTNSTSLKYWILAAIVALGAYARAADLAWHFAHVDDMSVSKNIMDFKRAGFFNLFSVPAYSIYAPFQFFATYFLVSPAQATPGWNTGLYGQVFFKPPPQCPAT